MVQPISFEDFAGGGSSEQSSVPSSSETPSKSRDSSTGTLSYAAFTGRPEDKSEGHSVIRSGLEKLKQIGGEAAAVADFVLSMPAFTLATGAELAGTVQAAAGGVPVSPTPGQLNPVTAMGVGREHGRYYNELLGSPMQKLLNFMGENKVYEQSLTSRGLSKFAELVEEAGAWTENVTGGKLDRNAIPMLVDTLMVGAVGRAGGRAKSPMTPAQRVHFEELRQQARRTLEREQQEAQGGRPLTPEEFVARVPVQDQINQSLGIKTEAERAAELKRRKREVSQAVRGQGELTAEEQAELERRGVRTYENAAQSEFMADERMSNEAEWRKHQNDQMAVPEVENVVDTDALPAKEERIGQAEILRIMQKPGHERTAEDLITLREARKQGGNVSQEALMLLGAAGIGALAGTELSDEKLRGAFLGGAAGLQAGLLMALPGKSVPSRFRQGGAVKAPGGMWHPEAVDRLSEPLKGAFFRGHEDMAVAPGMETPGEVPVYDWANKAIRNYLNKYAGTERSPLKDVELPNGSTWGKAWDEAISSKPVSHHRAMTATRPDHGYPEEFVEQLKKVPNRDEPVFQFSGGAAFEQTAAGESLTSYLSHVGDYLRQNVVDNHAPKFYEANKALLESEKFKDQHDSINQYADHGSDYVSKVVKMLTDGGVPLKDIKEINPLQNYDLVRAVRETAANDAKVAKQMEKAAASSMKDMPVYKEYPDGMKWVELKLPEKLMEDQKKQVRRMTPQEIAKYGEADPFGMPGERIEAELRHTGDYPENYIALGADGKPIKNAYTGGISEGATPQRAWLAGKLAEEGNQMGHCVGGYCEGVAAGQSRIFSLRDKQGRSHVTIEVEPGGTLGGDILIQRFGERGKEAWEAYKKAGHPASMHKFIQEKFPDIWQEVTKSDITQIKGKQNRAPIKEYLPYVQDFVKSGKWGEVGDLGHTGLVDWKRKGSFSEDRLAGRLEGQTPDGQRVAQHDFNFMKERFGDERFVPEEEFEKARKESVPAYFNRQRGFIDQKLVVGLSAVGLGAIAGSLLASDDKAGAALLGAFAGSLVMLPGAKERFKSAVDHIDYGLGALSTRIGNISPALRQRGREYEMRVLTEAHRYLHQVAPFMKELAPLPKKQMEELSRAILTNDKDLISYLMKGNVPLVDSWRQVRNTLNELGTKLQGHGRFKTMLDDYFPRLVKDVEGLKAALGAPERTHLEQVLAKAEADSARVRGSPLSNVEISSIINKEIQGFRRAKGYQPGFAKARGVDTITEQLQPFYHTPAESLFAYIRGAAQDLELAKFFGKDVAQTKIGGQYHINVSDSVGNIVGRELKEGKITPAQAKELISMIQSRLQGGERASSRWIQEIRNAGNIGLLGNIVSAVTQLGDAATSIYMQGFRPAMTAMARVISGREKINTSAFGLADHIAEEFVSRTRTAAWLNAVFKYSGFTAIDRFGKNVALDAALNKYTRLAQSPNGIKEIAKKYERAYGDEFPALVADLKAGVISERVRAMLFGELSDMQPISRLEMPQAYLDNPNGRLLYMLKTFMLKQMDIVRRDVYNEVKKGTPAGIATGLKNATAYAMVLGLSGAATSLIQDWLLGRSVHFEAGDVLENILKTFGWASFARDKLKKGHPAEALLASAAPPYKIIDDIISRDPRAVQYIPLIGKLYYFWELGGRERAEIAKKKGTGEDLSDRAAEYRQQQREKARERKER